MIVRRSHRAWIAALAALSLAGAARTADARPKRRDSKAAFDRGVVAYQKGDFVVASEALGKSYQLEHDVETLFAWAQAERKLEHCGKAIELYGKILEFKLPAANKAAVEQKLEECRTIVAAQAPRPAPSQEPPASPPAPVAPSPSPSPPPARVEPAAPPPLVVSSPPRPPVELVARRSPAPPIWYREPITLTLLGVGLATTVIGGGFMISAHSEHVAVSGAGTLDEARQHSDNAKSRLQVGLVTGSIGIAVVGGGVAWMLLHRDPRERRTVTGWLAPGGGGLAFTGPL